MNFVVVELVYDYPHSGYVFVPDGRTRVKLCTRELKWYGYENSVPGQGLPIAIASWAMHHDCS